ncbi:sensor histidine kinase [Oxalobacteraceae bacterium A2-2]
MRRILSSLPGYVLMVLSVALLGVAAALYMGVGGPAEGPPLHLESADWQQSGAAGYRTPPAELHADQLPPDWRSVVLPFHPTVALLRQATRQDPAAVVVDWLRLRPGSLPPESRLLALYAARIRTDGTIAVYVDGRLVHRAQQHGPLWNSSRTPLWLALERPEGAPPPREILLRLEHTAGSQVAVSTLWLGSSGALAPRHLLRQWLQQELPALLSASFMAVGLFALAVWLRRPHDTGYLLFFNMGATSFLRGLHFYVPVPIANDWFAWLTVNALFWQVCAVHFFLCLLHGRPLKWLTRALLAAGLLVALLTMPTLAVLPNTPRVTPLLYPLAALMGALACVVGGLAAWRSSAEGRMVAAGIGVCTLLGVADWLLQNNVASPEGWYLGAYTNAVCFIVFGVLMYRRYLDALVAVERANARLAERLRAREAELEDSHQRLRAIELQQTISGERQRLMQDMHDGLGSSLISAIRSVEGGGLNEAAVAQVLKDCLDDLKLTIDSMEPVEADLLLLLATLRFRLEPRLEGSGVALRWQVRDLPPLAWLNPSSALHILRVLQEAIANILRHTRATEIRIGTALERDGVTVTVADNGQGFDSARALREGGGRGLRNQQRRAQALRGVVDWQSGADGTRFTLWLPLQHQ